MEWHENQLAQEEKYINATDKQPHPDTERERKLKDYYKNPYAEDEASYPAEKSNF